MNVPMIIPVLPIALQMLELQARLAQLHRNHLLALTQPAFAHLVGSVLACIRAHDALLVQRQALLSCTVAANDEAAQGPRAA